MYILWKITLFCINLDFRDSAFPEINGYNFILDLSKKKKKKKKKKERTLICSSINGKITVLSLSLYQIDAINVK